MHFQDLDRPVNMEFGYWEETIARWHQQGLPPDCTPITKSGQDDPLAQFFGLDIHWLAFFVPVNATGTVPAFSEEVLEEDETTQTKINADGVTLRISKTGSSVPRFIKFPVECSKDFETIKQRYDPNSQERYPDNWNSLVAEYKTRDYPLGLNINGFFGQPRNWMGFENLSYAYYDQPDLIKEMCGFWAEFNIEVLRKVFKEVDLDFIHFWEDMAYNHGSMISDRHFHQFMMPAYKKVMEFIYSHGVDVIIVDSDGFIEELAPLFLEVGINAILPMEIAAGNNLQELRKRHGQRLRLIGGIDKRALIAGPEAIESELKNKLPQLLLDGGYIPAVDHLIPPDVSLDNYKFYIELKAKLLAAN